MVTKEKAIEILEVYKALLIEYKTILEESCSNQLDKDIQAFDMAINALKEPDFFITPEYESNKEIKLNDPMWNIEQMPYIEPKIRGKRHE